MAQQQKIQQLPTITYNCTKDKQQAKQLQKKKKDLMSLKISYTCTKDKKKAKQEKKNFKKMMEDQESIQEKISRNVNSPSQLQEFCRRQLEKYRLAKIEDYPSFQSQNSQQTPPQPQPSPSPVQQTPSQQSIQCPMKPSQPQVKLQQLSDSNSDNYSPLEQSKSYRNYYLQHDPYSFILRKINRRTKGDTDEIPVYTLADFSPKIIWVKNRPISTESLIPKVMKGPGQTLQLFCVQSQLSNLNKQQQKFNKTMKKKQKKWQKQQAKQRLGNDNDHLKKDLIQPDISRIYCRVCEEDFEQYYEHIKDQKHLGKVCESPANQFIWDLVMKYSPPKTVSEIFRKCARKEVDKKRLEKSKQKKEIFQEQQQESKEAEKSTPEFGKKIIYKK